MLTMSPTDFETPEFFGSALDEGKASQRKSSAQASMFQCGSSQPANRSATEPTEIND
jgi:hypothetical protein